jgi:hypothetical protein
MRPQVERRTHPIYIFLATRRLETSILRKQKDVKFAMWGNS